MELSEEGTTSLSNTSVENVVVAALLDGRFVSPCGPVSLLVITELNTLFRKKLFSALYYSKPYKKQKRKIYEAHCIIKILKES